MRQHNYHVYIMSSLSRTLYTGVTNDLVRRVFEHKEGRPGSFTVRYHVNRLVYFEHLGDVSRAITREKEIERMTRRQKIKLIESINAEWRDLCQASESTPPESGTLRALTRAGSATREGDRETRR